MTRGGVPGATVDGSDQAAHAARERVDRGRRLEGELAGERQALRGARDPAAAGALGDEQRPVGGEEHLLRGRAVDRERGGAGGRLERSAPARATSSPCPTTPLTAARTRSAIGADLVAVGPRQEHGELVAAVAEHAVASRLAATIASATWRSSRSPAWWPIASLTGLKWSRSSITRLNGSAAVMRASSAGRTCRG